MSGESTFHEKFDRDEGTPSASNRATGLVFAAIFLVVGLYPLMGEGRVRIWALGVGAGVGLVALALPSLLAPLNRAWMGLALLLQKVTSPIVLGLVFYGTVVPIGFIRRLFGWDPLALSLDPEAETYWIDRAPPGPAPESMNRQF